MNPEDKVLPLKEEAPKEEGKPLSKDNEPKTAKAKGGKGKGSVSQKNARAREKAMTVIEKAERKRKGLKNRLGNSHFYFWDDMNDHDRRAMFEMTASLPGFKSNDELALACGSDLTTLLDWCFSVYGKEGDDKAELLQRKVNGLRAMDKRQFLCNQQVLAIGQPTMSIWLGKNYYGQKEADDKKELDLSDFFNVIIKPKLESK